MPQSLAQIFIHLVFSTKNRVPLIDEKTENQLFNKLYHAVKQSGNVCIIVGGYRDHVHILYKLHSTNSVSKTLELIKTISSKWAKKQGEQYLNFNWQDGYSAFSVNPSQVEIVKSYIANQKDHHNKRTFKEECRLFFQKYRVEYEEEYVWD